MMKRSLRAVLVLAGLAWLPAAQAEPAGQITHLSGTLSVKRADGTSKLLSIKSEIMEGDLLATQSETYARVKFNDGGEVVLRPDTQLKIQAYNYNAAKPESDNIVVSMFKGGLRAVTGLIGKRNRDKVSFQTETATIGIRGTHFGALLCQNDCGGVHTTGGQAPPNGLHIDVSNGAVEVTNKAGTVRVDAGKFGYVPDPNSPPVVVPANRAVPVTMPNSIAQNKGGGRGLGKGDDAECKM
jgi:hypothetical protein